MHGCQFHNTIEAVLIFFQGSEWEDISGAQLHMHSRVIMNVYMSNMHKQQATREGMNPGETLGIPQGNIPGLIIELIGQLWIT